MNLYRWIIVLALGPRALRNAWHVFAWLVIAAVVLHTIAANACSDEVSPGAVADVGTIEQAIDATTRELAPRQGIAFSREVTGLDEVASSSGNAQAESGCFDSDVKAYCCPSACAVKSSHQWTRASDVLRSCARGLGCKNVDGWTVFARCQCSRRKP